MVGKPKLPNWLAYIQPHRKPYLALGRGERQKYIAKLSKQTDLSDNSLRRMIAAAEFLEREGITDLPPGGRLPLGSVENIARIAAHEPDRRRELLDQVWEGRMTIDQLAEELEKVRKSAKSRVRLKATASIRPLEDIAAEALKERQINIDGAKFLKFQDVDDGRYFEGVSKPRLVLSFPKNRSFVVFDSRRFGGTAASFMSLRRELLRNILVAAALYDKVLAYTPEWSEDVEKLIEQVVPSMRSRIILIRDPDSGEPV
jgi:hypothetical protein